METLESYLGGEFLSTLQEVDTLTTAIERASRALEVTFGHGSWPYGYDVAKELPVGNAALSEGTVAMVLSAVGKLTGECVSEEQFDLRNAVELRRIWDEAYTKLKEEIEEARPSREGLPDSHFRSRTFGNDNAMTLSHLADLHGVLKSGLAVEAKKKLEGSLRELKKKLDRDIAAKIIDPAEGGYRATAFVLLRACRALHLVGIAKPTELRSFFESGLHDQLSFSAIPDSRFDPSELLFQLEGLLLIAPEAVDEALFDRVIRVLAEKQNSSAHWRSSTPFVASATGYIMLPLSVEGANSFVRSLRIIDKERWHDPLTPRALPLLSRFWSWLQARSVRFPKKPDCIGWHSEHVNEPELIHSWDTSQVIEFMIAYRFLLNSHVAHKTLQLSGVATRRPKPLVDSLRGWKASGTQKKPDWRDIEADRAPILSGGVNVYREIGEKFVKPRSNGRSDPSYSMLLYGPPGTGKSTVAKLIADALQWPMLTVTVSDFLGSGGAMVEARAKAVFQMLLSQRECVILFDEIDAFLLDRDSSFYRDQDTLFQFLTPGMLTKFNDLRAAKRSIFIIATNYANRIDPAIKRIGRIDQKLLLLPPDQRRREQMIEKALELANGKRAPTDKIASPTAEAERSLAEAAYYLGWNDIEGALKASVDGATLNTDKMRKLLEDADRSTGPKFYGRRFPTERPFKDEIEAETKWLYRLATTATDFRSNFLEAVDEGTEGTADERASIRAQAETMLDDIAPQ